MVYMDQEAEMKQLILEDDYLCKLIGDLNSLIKKPDYKNCEKSARSLIEKLSAKALSVKLRLDELTAEVISSANAFSELDLSALDGNLR